MQAHGIVEAGLDMACPMGRCPVEIADADGQGLRAALEIRPHGRTEDAELIFIRWLHADDGVGAEHIGADVKGRPAAIGRHIGRIGRHCPVHGVDEPLLRELRHLQPPRGIHHALRVQVGPERHDAPVLRGISLQALKYGLGILQDARALVQDDVRILRQAALVPCAVLIIRDIPLLRLHISEAYVAPVDVLLFHLPLPSFHWLYHYFIHKFYFT